MEEELQLLDLIPTVFPPLNLQRFKEKIVKGRLGLILLSLFQKCKELGFQGAACGSISGNSTYLTEMSAWCLEPENLDRFYISFLRFNQSKLPPLGHA